MRWWLSLKSHREEILRRFYLPTPTQYAARDLIFPDDLLLILSLDCSNRLELSLCRWGVPTFCGTSYQQQLQFGLRQLEQQSLNQLTTPRVKPCIVLADSWIATRVYQQQTVFYSCTLENQPLIGLLATQHSSVDGEVGIQLLSTAARGAVTRVQESMPVLPPSSLWGAWLMGSLALNTASIDSSIPERELDAFLISNPLSERHKMQPHPVIAPTPTRLRAVRGQKPYPDSSQRIALVG